MRPVITLFITAVVLGVQLASQQPRHGNAVIQLIEQGKPVFGLYTPSAFPPAGHRGAAPPPDTLEMGKKAASNPEPPTSV